MTGLVSFAALVRSSASSSLGWELVFVIAWKRENTDIYWISDIDTFVDQNSLEISLPVHLYFISRLYHTLCLSNELRMITWILTSCFRHLSMARSRSLHTPKYCFHLFCKERITINSSHITANEVCSIQCKKFATLRNRPFQHRYYQSIWMVWSDITLHQLSRVRFRISTMRTV